MDWTLPAVIVAELGVEASLIRTQTHDCKRHRTITLFAELNYLDGRILSRTEKHQTHVEWIRFLKQIDRETPPNQQAWGLRIEIRMSFSF